jgi:hypothetical protein
MPADYRRAFLPRRKIGEMFNEEKEQAPIPLTHTAL